MPIRGKEESDNAPSRLLPVPGTPRIQGLEAGACRRRAGDAQIAQNVLYARTTGECVFHWLPAIRRLAGGLLVCGSIRASQHGRAMGTGGE